jgi:3-hydroxyisobutyrate dehydrogenase-like beta-hydroxyacid dehydrogenase
MAGARVAYVGLEEAGLAFAAGMGASVVAYDRKTDEAATRDEKLAEAGALGIEIALSNADAVEQAAILLSLVTADQALETAARTISPHSLFLDFNSVVPETKRQASTIIKAAGARYLDAAVMAPVDPARRAVPPLVSGWGASAGAETPTELGFSNARIVSREVGAPSSIKMIRSVMLKGLEALAAECVLAADMAGVRNEVIASPDASLPGADWAAKANYDLDCNMVNGLRRAAEMAEG